MQTINQHTRIIVPVLLVTLLGVLSEAVPGTTLRVLFLFCGCVGIILCFCGDLMKNEKTRRTLLGITGGVFGVIFVWSVFSAGSLSAYGKKVQSFFLAKPSDNAADEIYREASDNALQTRDEIASANKVLFQIINELEETSAALAQQQFLSSKHDPSEEEEIAGIIRSELEQDAKRENPWFKKVKTDRHTVELFYKMRISHHLCQYVNCIKALESVGIDCKSMSIDEYTLMLWDTEMLFATYSMRQDMLDEAAQGVVYEETQYLYFQEFKVSLDKHSDTFDYGNWHKTFDPGPAERIVKSLDNDVMNFYEKFHMNFKKDID